jgi:glycine cleavage system transcriptional repressor
MSAPAYRPDILNELCQFFTDHHIELENLTCDTYMAPQTGGTMLNATITVTLPAGTQISWLRDQFLDFADAMNLDALIEPWRPQHPNPLNLPPMPSAQFICIR